MLKTILLVLVQSAVAYASDGGEHHLPTTQEIMKAVGPQLFNFGLFLCLLIYFLRKPIIGFFADRLNNYKSALNAASSALAEAQAKKNEIVNNIKNLEKTRAETINRARAEAEAMRNSIISEAKQTAQKFLEDAERTVKVEIEKAKLEIRDQLLKQSIVTAEKSLLDQLDDKEQKRLQKEFASKI